MTERSPADLPTSVWITAQRDARTQRSNGGYHPASTAHPAKMLPAIAAHAITHYTRPGDLVLDPMCGIGTTLVEAVRQGRNAIGVEYEPRWAITARTNLAAARRRGDTGTGKVICADARHLTRTLAPAHRGKVALVLTSPPYGASLHGQVVSTRESGRRGVAKFDYRYSHDPANLAHAGTDALLDAFTTVLAECRRLLRPDGHVAITTRPWRERGELVDLPSAVIAAGRNAGLTPVERCVALLAGLRDGHLVARPSFFQLKNIRDARAAGVPLHLIVHEDVLVFTATPTPPPEPSWPDAAHWSGS
ncbi:DNA methyltransferase [Streptomyces sp. NPDC050315]|uniref:TRM11 family SAM-dependent methyltransferase n=1 Tax=Streptomyces sp. NPDC050315 TaxID=3155039 RepID=UPI0034217904